MTTVFSLWLTLWTSGDVSFTVRGDDSRMETTTPGAAQQKILDLRNGNMVRFKFSHDGGIDEIDVGHPSWRAVCTSVQLILTVHCLKAQAFWLRCWSGMAGRHARRDSNPQPYDP
ncbi:MAG: hypothetical protein ACLQFR_14245 [Streptosporangiaceae bacterium]